MDVLAPVRTAVRAGGFAAWTATIVYGHRLAARVKPDLWSVEARTRWIQTWSHGIIPVLGVRLHRAHGDAPAKAGPFLVVANHRSPLDILVTVHLVGGVVLSHHGVAAMPIVGDAARATDTIFVDRDDRSSGARAIREMRSKLKEGRNLIVFPEGTTYPGDEVRPFKRGVFSAAKGLPGVTVLPVGLAYPPGCEFVGESFGNHLKRMTARPQTPVWVSIGEPTPVPRNANDEGVLRDTVQRLVDASAQVRDRSIG